MTELVKKLFSKKEETSAFSEFFITSKSKEKARIFKEAARKANEDQKKIVEEYETSFANKKN